MAEPKQWLETAGRIGYAAKGTVYGMVGLLAAQAALSAGGDVEGARGAIQEIGEGTLGQVLLVLTGVALIGYVIWRFTQALADTEDRGADAKGLVMRAAYVISGITYSLLAYFALRLVFGNGGGGSGSNRQTWTAELLAQPFGKWLVGGVGAVIVGVGLYHFYRVYKASFMEKYEAGSFTGEQRTWMRRIGRFGLAARGVTFCLIGGFFMQAARQADPSEAEGLEAALETLGTYGTWMLAAIAFGFIAYGIYCFSRAKYRRFEV